ncbi:MAG TPA: hypothetical protein VGR26_06965 [Acidimicrobiales bacterium]|nr:hypothetical protein [Acidimicrobiales bacterium]
MRLPSAARSQSVVEQDLLRRAASELRREAVFVDPGWLETASGRRAKSATRSGRCAGGIDVQAGGSRYRAGEAALE